ncbi:MAG TPA: excisionase family DNA-binding protein [Candidatus Xenobia bacterium]|nr:excisionase family DNA-binding protein [Candidatus Xenobia bacterium]
MHSIQETAFLLNLSTRKVHYLIAEKKIKTLKCGKRRLIPRTEILRLSREAR